MLDPEESLFENGLCMEGQRNCDPEKRCVAESLLERKEGPVTVISRRKEVSCITPIELYFFTYTHLLPKNLH
jgi:hypothetical protein